jgi:uncharacterized membrane-anchored protein
MPRKHVTLPARDLTFFTILFLSSFAQPQSKCLLLFITEVDKLGKGLIFSTVVLILTRNGLGYILGDFFTSSSGRSYDHQSVLLLSRMALDGEGPGLSPDKVQGAR